MALAEERGRCVEMVGEMGVMEVVGKQVGRHGNRGDGLPWRPVVAVLPACAWAFRAAGMALAEERGRVVEMVGEMLSQISSCKSSVKVHIYRHIVSEHWSDRLEEVFQGATVLRSKDLEGRGVSRTRIREAVDEGLLDHLGRGLYALHDAAVTEHHSLVQAARRVPNGVVCLLSALCFHDITSQNPHEIWLAIGPKDRLPKCIHPPIKIVRFGEAHFLIGLENHEVEGVALKVYSIARTIVDLFRYRNKIGIDVAMEGLKEGWREKRFTLKEINEIAACCRMTRVMKPYLESLAYET